MTTWRKELEIVMGAYGESLSDAVASTLTEEQLDTEFDDGYGGSEGCPFTVWTPKRVYFSAVYDGSEWVASVARHPDGHPTRHIGGE